MKRYEDPYIPVSGVAWYKADEVDARIQELEKALRGMESMYTHVWDRVDGSLVCMPESVDRFEAAHREARKALGL